jgi:hypothetical protein
MVYTMHEPFSAGYYTKVSHYETLKDLDTCKAYDIDFDKVIEQIISAEKRYATVFVKELAYCVLRQTDSFDKNFDFFKSCKHVALIRDPKDTIPSLVHQMRRIYGIHCELDRIESDIGVDDLYEIIKRLPTLGILDSDDLVENAQHCLKRLCSLLDLEFSESSLRWEEGSLGDWKIWESLGWHDDVKNSTQFKKVHKVYECENDPNVKCMITRYQPLYYSLKKDQLLIK